MEVTLFLQSWGALPPYRHFRVLNVRIKCQQPWDLFKYLFNIISNSRMLYFNILWSRRLWRWIIKWSESRFNSSGSRLDRLQSHFWLMLFLFKRLFVPSSTMQYMFYSLLNFTIVSPFFPNFIVINGPLQAFFFVSAWTCVLGDVIATLRGARDAPET